MKLSMNMLAWFLRDFHPQCSIKDDRMNISGVRLLKGSADASEEEFVYFTHNTDFSFSTDSSIYILSNRQNRLTFYDCDEAQLLNALLCSFDYFNAWEQRLADAAAKNAGIQALIEIGADVISNPQAVNSFDLKTIGYINRGGTTNDPYWEYNAEHRICHPLVAQAPYYDMQNNIVQELPDVPILIQNVYPSGAPVLMMRFKEGNDTIGMLEILQTDPSTSEMNLQLSPLLGNYYKMAAEFTSPMGISRTELQIFTDTLNGKDVGESNLRTLETHLPEQWRLILFQHTIRTDHISRKALEHSLRANSDFLFAASFQNYVAAIVRDTAVFDPSAILHNRSASATKDVIGQSIASEAKTSISNFTATGFQQWLISQIPPNWSVGISMPENSLNNLRKCISQSIFALQQAEGKPGLHFCESFAFDYMIRCLKNNEEIQALIHPAILKLKTYDRNNKSVLLETLKCYLDNNLNQAKTASQMKIHLNTLKYRLQRIEECTTLSLRSEDSLDYLRLSIWIYSGS